MPKLIKFKQVFWILTGQVDLSSRIRPTASTNVEVYPSATKFIRESLRVSVFENMHLQEEF